ncbi:MAG: MFS transporter [Planctomycetaceae bacterium]
MRIGVVSDTHGHVPNTRAAVRVLRQEQVETVLHCGDIGSPEVVHLFSDWPTHFVFGNCDHNESSLRFAIRDAGLSCHERMGDIELAGVRIAVIHSDDQRRFQDAIYGGKYGLVCYGHTHVAKLESVDGTKVLNPGALYRATPHTIAIVDLPGLTIRHLPSPASWSDHMSAPAPEPSIFADNSGSPLPPLRRDSSFWGMTATQFLGAFNDNLFKQLVLLIGTDYVLLRELDHDPYQMQAQGMFALPFVLFSGIAGWLADRVSKRTIVVLSKVAEIGVMLAGLIVFRSFTFGTDGYLYGLLAVLFFMGMQSAFFGPAKYGILPEMLRDRDLPQANGLIQMTTFLAIIFGTALCGFLKDGLQDGRGGLWIISLACIVIAILGTLTSLMVRRTRIADPAAELTFESFAVHGSTWRMLVSDKPLRNALMASTLFWFLGGVALPTVNTFGKHQLVLGDSFTSILTAQIGLGIALGCLVAGLSSKGRVNFHFVRWGAWGMLICFGLLAALPVLIGAGTTAGYAAAPLLALLGFSAGVFAVPLQVYLQARPPADQKGRMIGAMNLFNWLGILAAALAYGLLSRVFTIDHIARNFAVLAVLILPVALRYRPHDQELSDANSAVP